MLVLLIGLVAVGGVSAKTPIKPPTRCPVPPPVPIAPPDCGPNAYFERCSNPCPPQNCSTLWSNYVCPKPPACCKPECRCKDGFLRDDVSGLCVCHDECFARCGPKEHFVRGSTECRRTCANYVVTGPQSLCKPFTGCVCNDGLVRENDDGTGACVCPKKCPPRQCPRHEHFDNCPSVCLNETCISKNPDYICLLPAIPLPCKPRCICDKGYLRDTYGNCIPENHCPIKKCAINEVWRCATMCPSDSCRRLEPGGFKCPPGVISVCIPVCACKDGYLRNEKGICIPRELCPASLKCGINEVAVECATVSPPQTCESIYTLYKPVGPTPCTPGCDCRPGYLRNKANICIPSEFCPTVPQNQCGPYQEYKKCGTSCEPSCSDLDNPNVICTDQCVSGCFCIEGYYKDGQGNCIPKNECPLPVCNKPNEIGTDCGSYCDVKTCEDYKRTDIVCPAVCVRGCFCLKGYVRNAYGVCVLPDQCPPQPVCLQENEEYQSCGSSCPDNCENYLNTERICTANCVPGCNCKAGFVRNLVDRTCVKPEQCPSKNCTGENEALNYCASYCPVTCSNRFNHGDWLCATVCRVACDCIPGTLRNDRGVCVPVEQCTPPICRQNEKYNKCGTACPLTCENYRNPPKVCTRQCVEDCFCEEGYVRNRHLQCVKPEQCEPICPAGEKFNECSAHCQDTCENYDKPNRICTYQCQSGCVCEEGTVRRKDGKCVAPSECKATPTCLSTEVYSPCSAHCEPTCESPGTPVRCTRNCVPGCKCREGLVRRKDRQCVKVEECSPPVCGQNEEYKTCGTACPLTCDNRNNPPQICTEQCVKGCFCKPGFVKDANQRCVKPEECKPQSNCTALETYDSCNAHCEKTCETYGTDVACLPYCVAGCRCNDGLVRKDGQCVTPDKCPTPPVCGPNAKYTTCGTACPLTCENYNDPPQICTAQCVEGCFCEPGFVKDSNQRCVKPKECPPPVCGPNAQYTTCGTACPLTCENYNKPPQPCTAQCVKGCFCKPGFVKDANQRCVKPKECPSQCPVNERYVNCVLGLCIPKKCDELGFPVACPDLAGPCDGGCVCVENYVRNSDGVCIPRENCPSCGGDFNATAGCGINCGRNCLNYDKNVNCAIPLICLFNACDCKKGYVFDSVIERCVAPPDCSIPCNGDINAEKKDCPSACPPTCAKPTTEVCTKACVKEGCQCREGYILGPNGKCVKVENCPDNLGCNGDPNAIVTKCPNPCQPVCKNDAPPPFCPAICLPPGCQCKPGYVLSKPGGGKCIKPDECEKRILCPNNETWIDCKASYCKPQTCKYLNTQLNCPQVTDPCPGGCICKDGMLRDGNGVCIPEEQCPNYKPCSDPNAERVECASQCQSSCARPDPGPCILSCKLNSCVCKKGYVLSEKGGKCVPVDQCPKDAPCNGDSNAVIKVNPIPCPSTCASPNASPYCKKYAPPVGCECKPGYLKSTDDFDGKCIKPEECEGGNPCGVNGTFVWCNAGCPTNYCPTNDNRAIIACSPPYPCPSGCSCKLNYRKKSYEDPTCILASDCPPVNCTRPNEIWAPCPSDCLAENCLDINNQPSTCNTLVLNCQPKCICKKGHFRDDDGICVPANQCPNNQPCSDPNAERVQCASPCQSTCAKPDPGPCILSCKLNSCVCKKGYVLSQKGGKCVPVDQCPKDVPCNGDSNAVIKVNPIPCPSTCASPNASPYCKKYAPPVGCECKPGYLKSTDDFDGKCIKPEECEGGNPCGVNGTFVWCNAGCPTNYCPTNDNRGIIACSPPRPCPNGCSCKFNYKKKSYEDPTCILASDCPPVNCTRQNEIWSPCPSACLAENCADVNNQPSTCNTLVAVSCQPRCICKKGHFRNDKGICVPANQCPNNQPCSDPNAERVECASQCQSTCAKPDADICILSACTLNGCVCKKGYVLSEKGGKCILVDQCPKDAPCDGDPNAVIKENPAPCPSTCAAPNEYSCYKYRPPVGCECREGYLKSSDDPGGKCIKPDECIGGNPCGINGTFVRCRANCSTEFCPINDQPILTPCELSFPCPRGCACKENYRKKNYKDETCILASECPPIPCTRPNEIFNSCASICLDENCPDNKPPYTCILPLPPLILCQPKCVCREGYSRNKKDICIPTDQCPTAPCGSNEEYTTCGTACPLTCENYNSTSKGICTKQCVKGCFCKAGFVRDSDNRCVKPEECPNNKVCSDPNAERVACAPHQSCRASCAKPTPGPCPKICIINDCVCKKGFILSEKGGKCIPVDQCPQDAPCDGDPNAVIKENPVPCPSTCAAPNEYFCKKYTPPVGCECREGYLKSSDDPGSKCIKPDECNGGNPCGTNGTFVRCRANCPTEFCPINDQPILMPCELSFPCPRGCACKENYRKKSYKDETCILASECPAIPCTRPNEIFNSCASICLNEDCPDIKPPYTCILPLPPLILCQPKCVCREGYSRNKKDICIPTDQCPNNQPCSDPNAERVECPSQCQPTCAQPNPGACILTCNKNTCVCKKGFILSEKGGKCIPVDKCPRDVPCNGDSNAVIKANPIPCPSTCSSPYASPFCKRYAPPVGCECKPGFIQSENDGKCIKPDECEGGNPCGPNGDFVWCHVDCPNDNCPVNDNRGIIACDPPYPCPSGCACKLNHRKKSSQNNTCILASDCPPVKCTRPNEIWAPCPSACLAENCADVNNQPSTCNTLVLNCQPQCICKKGYFRNNNDICVPANHCPTPQCGQNEEYTTCGTACPINCQNYNSPNKARCIQKCVEGCFCKDGFIRDSDKRCVKPEECSTRRCGFNEEYTTCGTACPLTCQNYNSQNKTICTQQCVEGCFCKAGFIRDSDKRCVKPEECSNNCSDPNAERVPCPPQKHCRVSCANPTPEACSLICIASDCICKTGFILSEKDGKCVPVDKCPIQKSCNGDPNAVIKECPLPCPATCSAPNAIPCKRKCIPIGCECKDGFIISESGGKCIRADDCKGGNPCGRNETFVSCKVPCPSNNCPIFNSQNTVICETPNPCYPGCVCKINYRRRSAENQQCIYASECPPLKCNENEEWSGCPSACLREDCSDVNNQPVTCNTLLLNCQPKCICKKGFYRDSNRECIPANQCPNYQPCSDPNAQRVECATQCPPTCARPNPGDCILSCKVNSCVCKPGYILSGKDGKCIPIDKCPNNLGCNGDTNSIITSCPHACPLSCQFPLARPCPALCLAVGCQCKSGYILSGPEGKCIRPDQCPKKNCGPNEVYSPNSIVCPPQTCDSIYSDYDCRNALRNVTGCDCISGYLRNGTIKDPCIPSEQCPTPGGNPCGSNEHYETNSNKCDLTCKSLYSYNEAQIGPCQERSGCFCDDGYYRNNRGICVTKKQCPKPIICPANEEISDCYNTCHTTCKTRFRGDGKVCPQACLETGCLCKSGYLRHDNGTCVPVDQCSPPRCNDHEVYTTCGTACPKTCQNRGQNCTVCTFQCIEGCFCAKGYIRANEDTCVLPKDCPPRTCSKPNEVFDECPNDCPSVDNCSNIWSKFNCTNREKCCKPQCRCKDGYLRKNDVCVPGDQCTSNCGPNEVYSANSIVCPPQTCASIYSSYDCSKALKNVPGCDCISGYLRNGTEKDPCIPSEQCPSPGGTPSCGLNEHYETDRSTCDASCKNKDIDAPIGPCPATSGCFCDDGFYRNTNGTCVTSEQCPAPRCNENEVYTTCGSACENTCQNRGANCTGCTAQCIKGCFCRKGYLRGDDNTCVKPCDCPPRTCSKPNEVFDECPNDCPSVDNCSNLWSKFNCTNREKCCKPQCRCKNGYLRKNGVCVPSKQCTSNCGPNEVYSANSIVCPPQTCASIYSSYDCSKAAKNVPGCDCLSGYLRNGTEKDPCIPSEQCPSPGGTPSCGLNEHYETDRSTCDASCKNKDIDAPFGPCAVTSGCYCDDGFYRNTNGICVTSEQCPKKIICPANEVLSECYNSCLTTCKTRFRGDGKVCHTACIDSGCVCKPDFLRHDNGTCVPIDKCSPPRCNENEIYTTCGSACESTCQNRGANCTVCTDQCIEGCFCRKGYLRGDDNTCVKPCDCPPRTCSNPNEVFDVCPDDCPSVDKCTNIWVKIDCSKREKCCKPQCRCKDGYLRKSDGVCVPTKDCTAT